MSAHTAGPWRMNGTAIEQDADPGEYIGSVDDETNDHFAANARLIAAAPEMYEALKGLYAVVARLTVDDPTHYEVANAVGLSALQAHAVITKIARGQEPADDSEMPLGPIAAPARGMQR